MNNQSNVKKVIGVVSGKGGVGKSSVTSMLAVATQRLGYKVAIRDADITGPSIPQAFGIRSKATGTDEEITPVASKTGIKVISINALLEDTTDPVVWRGPVLSGVIDQFWNNVVWGDIDVMYVDMPPGTGDVALTVFQSAAGRSGHRDLSAGAGIHDCRKGSQNGAADERSGHRDR